MRLPRLFRSSPLPSLPAPYLPEPVNLNQALELVLVNAVKSQAETAAAITQAVTSSLSTLSEIQASVFTRRRLKRGGERRAAGANRGKNGRFERGSRCRLCVNPMLKDPTVEEVRAHATHDSGNLYATDDKIETRSDGAEVIECPDCAAHTPGHTHQVH